MWWNPVKFEDQKPFLEKRMALVRAVRRFFEDEGFWEVETPVLQVCPTFDTHIHAFETALLGPDLQGVHARTLYLHTSPELAMKKLLVAGLPKIFQICHSFRNGEDSRLHSAEFTILEWYRTHADYTDIMADCEALLRHSARALEIEVYAHKDLVSDPFADFQKISVVEAFDRYAGMDLASVLDDTDGFSKMAAHKGVRVAEGDAWDDVFFRVMAEKIEPHLGAPAPTILYDYPVSMAALSRKSPDDPRFAQRFELYVCGIELANAFTELTDPVEQRTRFAADMALKEEIYGMRYPLDEDFIKALECEMPRAGGIALGIDRLVMLATHAARIEQVLWAGKP